MNFLINIFKIKTIVFIPLFLIVFSVNFNYGQNKRIEIRLMKCWYDSFGINKVKAKEHVYNYKLSLIEQGVLNDTTYISHINHLELIANDKVYKKPTKFIVTEIENMAFLSENYIKCRDSFVVKDSIAYKSSQLYK